LATRPRSTFDPRGDPSLCGYWGGRRTDGELCVGYVVKGTKRCYRHAGKKLQQAKAEGAIVTELERWGLDGHSTLVDPGELLLRLVTQSAWRVQKYSELLGRAHEAAESGESFDDDVRRAKVASLIGYRYGVDRDGNRFPIEEAIRGLVLLEAQERDRAAVFAAKAIAAGLAERQVRLAETQGTLIVEMLRRVQAALDLSPEQEARYMAVVGRELRELAGEAAPS
jgi:hypothetical protein